ncbi:hypothetical protein [Bhargavaea beijingensis]|uniref:Uncharacterized protein n=1 Tax=Bhargavaea beijingensis TaxID=426756 RepID=A0A1G6Z6J3_9BACL|nr:hypothetical protein [Bhargavaea beijingensis]SDD98258.1 hypothetical protein SAMN04488126_102225 [Bhargavaea beijingensis]
MSDNWVFEARRLKNAVGLEKADEIAFERLYNPDNIQKKLLRIKPGGEVIEKVID